MDFLRNPLDGFSTPDLLALGSLATSGKNALFDLSQENNEADVAVAFGKETTYHLPGPKTTLTVNRCFSLGTLHISCNNNALPSLKGRCVALVGKQLPLLAQISCRGLPYIQTNRTEFYRALVQSLASRIPTEPPEGDQPMEAQPLSKQKSFRNFPTSLLLKIVELMSSDEVNFPYPLVNDPGQTGLTIGAKASTSISLPSGELIPLSHFLCLGSLEVACPNYTVEDPPVLIPEYTALLSPIRIEGDLQDDPNRSYQTSSKHEFYRDLAEALLTRVPKEEMPVEECAGSSSS